MKVRIQASEVVRYDQVVDMSEDDYQRLLEAQDLGEEEEAVWLVDQYLDNNEVAARSNFSLDDVVEDKP